MGRQRISNLGAAASALALLVAGCANQRPPVPIETPQAPAIVAEAEAASAEVRSTIVEGGGAVPKVPQTMTIMPKRGTISLNFPAADVRVVAKAVLGDLLHVRYAVAAGVSNQVSLVTPGPVPKSAVFGLFETALKNASLALQPAGGGFTIQPVSTAQASGPIAADVMGYGSELIELKFINADELRKLLDSVVPGVVTATDATRNAITIAGTTGQRKNAHDLIAQFDVNWLRNMAFALFVPQRTDSRLIAPELDKLINAAAAPTRGLVRLITMERLNGILAISAQPQYLDDVRRWIEILDREGESSEPRLFVYRVQNGRARDLAHTLNDAFGNPGSGDTGSDANPDPFAAMNQASTTQPAAPRPTSATPGGMTASGGVASPAAAGGAASDMQQTRITADEVNNAVIVFGTPKEYAVVEDALRKLDIPPYQVLIEAAITEVSLTEDLRFGVQWNFQTGTSNFALGEGTTPDPTRILPGFSYFFAGNNISAALNALEQRTNIKVVSAPKLLVLNNQTAALQVGDEVPIQTQSAVSVVGDSPIVNAIEYRDTGVILKVTPRVNAGGLVLLDISQEVSDISDRTIQGISSPIISTRRVSTSVAVQDGQVIALGGLFRDSKSFGKNGIPILSRIPVLGSLLFGNTHNLDNRTELIILLKPHVLRTVDDGRAVTEELRSKLRTLEPFRTQGRIP